MRSIKSFGSAIENKLCEALNEKGYKYKRNYKKVIGTPDIVFVKQKIAVFCDSEFWHGWNWIEKKKEFKSNKEFWYKKIESNIRRDKKVNRSLKKDGWLVLRFWGRKIDKNLDVCVKKIEEALKRKRNEIQHTQI